MWFRHHRLKPSLETASNKELCCYSRRYILMLFPLVTSQLPFLSCIFNNKCKVVYYIHTQDFRSFKKRRFKTCNFYKKKRAVFSVSSLFKSCNRRASKNRAWKATYLSLRLYNTWQFFQHLMAAMYSVSNCKYFTPNNKYSQSSFPVSRV